jgi:UDP-N-acetylglucosamine 2-epimerase
MRIVSVVGARPQFIKAAVVSKALRDAGHEEYLIHTGQHYDQGMSQVFFEELDIPEPARNLEVGSGPHGAQTGAMLARIETILQDEQPDWLLVYGDTNSTVAGALAAAKIGIRVAHVEAGLRSSSAQCPKRSIVSLPTISPIFSCAPARLPSTIWPQKGSRAVFISWAMSWPTH